MRFIAIIAAFFIWFTWTIPVEAYGTGPKWPPGPTHPGPGPHLPQQPDRDGRGPHR